MLFTSGQLMIARRKNFQRIYDLTERVHPTWRDENTPSSDEVLRSLVLQTVKSLGITRPEWVADYYRIPKADARRVIAGLLAEGSLVETQVEGWMAPPCLMIPRAGDPTSPPGAGLPEPTLTTLLSPFDPVIWDRTRVKAMFDFDYTIECYLPEAKRRYGYFTLPILHRGRLVGRLDPKAHRKDGIFEVKKLILEAGIQPEADLAKDIAQAIQNCAGWHQTPRVKLGATEPAEFARLLEEALP
jgi:uncharacterized protein YcaQ